MADPLAMLLRTLQASANNQNIPAQMTWTALRNQGIPVGYEEFAARWDDEGDDGMLHQIVKKFDGHGLTIKTRTDNDQPEEEGQGGPDLVGQMAKSATDRAMKKGL
jgi:hypothetical protein